MLLKPVLCSLQKYGFQERRFDVIWRLEACFGFVARPGHGDHCDFQLQFHALDRVRLGEGTRGGGRGSHAFCTFCA